MSLTYKQQAELLHMHRCATCGTWRRRYNAHCRRYRAGAVCTDLCDGCRKKGAGIGKQEQVAI